MCMKEVHLTELANFQIEELNIQDKFQFSNRKFMADSQQVMNKL